MWLGISLLGVTQHQMGTRSIILYGVEYRLGLWSGRAWSKHSCGRYFLDVWKFTSVCFGRLCEMCFATDRPAHSTSPPPPMDAEVCVCVCVFHFFFFKRVRNLMIYKALEEETQRSWSRWFEHLIMMPPPGGLGATVGQRGISSLSSLTSSWPSLTRTFCLAT